MKRFLLIGIYVACIGCGSSCTKKQQEPPLPPAVKTAEVLPDGDLETVRYPGIVRSSREVDLSFRVSGSIARIFVDEGDYVHAGQLVASLDTTDYATQLRATEAEYSQVSAQARRVTALYRDSVSTPEAYDRARYGLRQIGAKLAAHREQLAYTRVYAPFSGYVEHRFFRPCENVAAGMPVVTLADGRRPEIEIFLPASDLVRRERFARYSCRFDLWPERDFRLSLRSVSRRANASRLYAVRLTVDGAAAEDGLCPGMTALVTITLDGDGGGLLRVPERSVEAPDGVPSVFVYDPRTGRVRQRPVEVVGTRRGGGMLVRCDSLRAGDRIVTDGAHVLRDGDRVRTLPETAETNIGGLL